MGLAHRFSGPGKPYEGLTTIRKGKVDWTGVARFVPDQLDVPLRRKKPTTWFVNSMSDLFHESLSNEEIAAVFAMMMACPWHTFQVLTKRPKRAMQWFDWVSLHGTLHKYIRGHANELRGFFKAGARYETYRGIRGRSSDDAWIKVFNSAAVQFEGPLPNVWLGVSCENQEQADKRIPLLMQCPAAVRWVSAEPLLERVSLLGHMMSAERPAQCQCGHDHGFTRCPNYGGVAVACHHKCDCPGFRRVVGNGLDWVVAGSESGHGARPMQIEWIESLRDQCHEARVPFFTKQIANEHDRKGGNPEHWPGGPWPRELPAARELFR